MEKLKKILLYAALVPVIVKAVSEIIDAIESIKKNNNNESASS